jgi:hypothetical protein
MKVGLSLPQRQICFKSGEFNDRFDKRLKMAQDNGSHAQALLRCLDEDTITYSEERLKQVQQALERSKNPVSKKYLETIIEIWSKYLKS